MFSQVQINSFIQQQPDTKITMPIQSSAAVGTQI